MIRPKGDSLSFSRRGAKNFWERQDIKNNSKSKDKLTFIKPLATLRLCETLLFSYLNDIEREPLFPIVFFVFYFLTGKSI
jgi:hypothetical protein